MITSREYRESIRAAEHYADAASRVRCVRPVRRWGLPALTPGVAWGLVVVGVVLAVGYVLCRLAILASVL